MSRKEKRLPSPPSPGSRFREEDRAAAPLMADQMAMAAAAGKIEQFMAESLPDSEHARKLAEMMMGMTGMMPPGRTGSSPAAGEDRPQHQTQHQPLNQASPAAEAEQAPEPPVTPPNGVCEAARNADVKGLMNLLRQEHSKRSGEGAAGADTDAFSQPPPLQQQVPPPQLPPASIEKILIDRVMAIAFEHDLTPDWVVMRALKLYVEGYEKTGRL